MQSAGLPDVAGRGKSPKRDRHEGRQTHYGAQLGALAPLIDWASQMAGFWRTRLDQLQICIKRMDR
jgi:hypothetical protein